MSFYPLSRIDYCSILKWLTGACRAVTRHSKSFLQLARHVYHAHVALWLKVTITLWRIPVCRVSFEHTAIIFSVRLSQYTCMSVAPLRLVVGRTVIVGSFTLSPYNTRTGGTIPVRQIMEMSSSVPTVFMSSVNQKLVKVCFSRHVLTHAVELSLWQ